MNVSAGNEGLTELPVRARANAAAARAAWRLLVRVGCIKNRVRAGRIQQRENERLIGA